MKKRRTPTQAKAKATKPFVLPFSVEILNWRIDPFLHSLHIKATRNK